MQIKNTNFGFGLRTPNMDEDMQRIAADRLMTNQLLAQQAQANADKAPYQFNLPQLNVPGYEIPPAPKFVPFSQSEEGKRVIEELTQKKADAEARQMENMNAAKEQLQEYLAKQKSLDLLPMAALTDAWTGSNMARYFKDEQDINRQLALELQKELMKYGQAGVETEASGLNTKLQLGANETEAESMLARQAYEAELRAKQAMYNTNIDAATKLKAAEDARKAQAELEALRQKNRLELERLRQRGKVSNESRLARGESRAIAKDLQQDKIFSLAPDRLKLAQIVQRYENAVKKLDPKVLAANPFSKENTELAGIYQEYISAQKEADRLGALTGSDLNIVWGQMPDATSMIYAAKGNLGGSGKQGILNRITEVKKKLLQDHQIGNEMLQSTYKNLPEAIDLIKDQDRIFKSKFKFDNPNIDNQPGATQSPAEAPAQSGTVWQLLKGTNDEYEYRIEGGKYKPTGKKRPKGSK